MHVRRSVSHGWKVWLILAAFLWSPGGAHSQTLAGVEAGLPVALVADRITFDSDNGLVTAVGSVEVYYGERTLTADQIVYNDRTGRIAASGAITLRDPTGTTVFASAADLDADLTDGLVQGARSVMGEHIRLAAVEGRRVDERYNTLSKVVYSPCKVCSDDPTPLWRIRARRVIHDEAERVIHYENATFDVFGVPVAWLPYFRHPDPTVKRASGFLVPSFSSSSTYGYGAKLPYYGVIDDQSDLTFTPFFTTNDGLILEGEYRRAFESGTFSIAGSLGYSDYDGEESVRGHVDTEGRFLLGDDIFWGWDVTFASDDGYLRRFDFNYPDRLTSEVYVERYRSSGYFDVAGVYFQSLRDNDPAGVIPVGAPVLDARYEIPGDVLGGDLSLFSSGHILNRSRGRDAGRLSLGLDWERQDIMPWGLSVTSFGEVRGDIFSITNDSTTGDDVTARLAPQAGLELRYPLVWDQTSGVSHVIEPVVQGILAPYGGNGNNIPAEDSLVTEFDETNVIDRNHFSGLDNVEEGPRVNLMVRYERISDEGLRFDASIGRTLRFRNLAAFSPGSGLTDAESDFVGAWQATYDPYVTIRHRMRVADDATITRNEFFGAFKIDPVTIEANYIFLEADPLIGALADREEITAEAGFAIDRNWSLSTFMQRDLQLGEFVQIGGQISYKNECCEIDVFLRRRFTDSTDAPASTSAGVSVKLLTLGNPDNDPGR